MSDYSDILYDPRAHTHDSCLKEIPACDMVVLIIGSRFGGTAVPSALSSLDIEFLRNLSTKPAIFEAKEKLSVTQLEVLKAIEQSIPVYAFVDEKVLHDHQVYEKNKDKKDVIDAIDFPSIQKKETARYVFEFINFLSHRVTNNSITPFARLDDIRAHLATQWSQLFQRLLAEDRRRSHEERRYRDFSERLDDLKAVVLASLATPDLRDAAKGAIQFRRLISFVSALRFVNHRKLLLSKVSWDDLLKEARIIDFKVLDDERGYPHNTLLILSDGTFYRWRYPERALDDLRIDWSSFSTLEPHAREAIVDALLGDRDARRFAPMLYYDRRTVDEYLSERARSPQPDVDAESDQDHPVVAPSLVVGVEPAESSSAATA